MKRRREGEQGEGNGEAGQGRRRGERREGKHLEAQEDADEQKQS